MKRALALILAGLALLTYPILAQYFARKNQMQAARAYASGVEGKNSLAVPKVMPR